MGDDETIGLKVNDKSVDHKSQRLQYLSLLKLARIGLITILFITSLWINYSYLYGGNSPTSSPSNTNWVLGFGLICITVISLIISFWNYHIRSIYLKDGPALVPERWGQIIAELIDVWKIHHAQSQSALSRIQKDSKEQNKKSNDLLESFLTLQEALTVRDEEISRLKKGYDSKIFKKFLLRFIRVDRSLNELEHEFSGKDQQKNYKYLSRLMRDALEECGVEEFIPEIGSDYRDAGPQISDDPIVIETKYPEKDFTIAGIESIGYVLLGEGEREVVIPSRVSIFRINPSVAE